MLIGLDDEDNHSFLRIDFQGIAASYYRLVGLSFTCAAHHGRAWGHASGGPHVFANRPTQLGKDVVGRIRRNRPLNAATWTIRLPPPQAFSISESGGSHGSSIDSASVARSSALNARACASIYFRSGSFRRHASNRLPLRFIEKALPRGEGGQRHLQRVSSRGSFMRHRTQQPSSPSHRASA